jgi:hypothetical protein
LVPTLLTALTVSFERRPPSDDPASSAALTIEAPRPQEGLRTPPVSLFVRPAALPPTVRKAAAG